MVRRMYPGAEFSPDAHLTQSVGVGDTEIHLTTTMWVPDPPNIAVINDATSPEVVLYTTKTDTVLGGLVRGLSVNGPVGLAHAHDAGIAVYCGDTAYARGAEIENIQYLFAQQVIGIEWDPTAPDTTAAVLIDADGNPIESLPFGNFDNHRTYANIKRCLLSPSGVPTFGTNARGDGLTLDGSAGRVMVAIPKFYDRFEAPSPTTCRWYMSPFPLSGFRVYPGYLARGGVERDYLYVGAYEASLQTRDFPNHAVAALTLGSATGRQPATGEGTIQAVAFTSGGTSIPQVGETLTGATSGATGIVVDFVKTGGDWPAGTAAGTIWLRQKTGAFQAENLNGTLSGTDVCSVGGDSSAVPMTIDAAREYAESIGPGWGLMNGWTRAAVIMLATIEYQSMNLQVELGRGIVDLAAGSGFAGKLTGADSSDTLIGPNGTGAGSGLDGQTPVVWRGIENPWGNTGTMIDGLSLEGTPYGGQYRVPLRDGSMAIGIWFNGAYEETAEQHPSESGYIRELLGDVLGGPLFLPRAVGGSASTFCCDTFTVPETGDAPIVMGGAWDEGDAAGLLRCDCKKAYYALDSRKAGARLEYIGPEGAPGTTEVITAVARRAQFPPPITTPSRPTMPYVAENDASTGTRAWLQPLRVLRQDGGACLAEPGTGETNLLLVSGYGFNIPVNATITKVDVVCWRYAADTDANNYVVDKTLRLILPGGALSAVNAAHGPGVKWGGTLMEPEMVTYSSANWGESLTPEMINHGDFGVALAAETTGPNGTCRPGVDHVGVRVYYTV